jgi:hypothetical protein
MIYLHIESVRVYELNNLRDRSGAPASFHFENSGLYRKALLNRKIAFFCSIQLRSNTGYFISPSGISDLCGTVTGIVTPKGSMSTEGEALQVSVLPYRFSICPTLVTRQMSILYCIIIRNLSDFQR